MQSFRFSFKIKSRWQIGKEERIPFQKIYRQNSMYARSYTYSEEKKKERK